MLLIRQVSEFYTVLFLILNLNLFSVYFFIVVKSVYDSFYLYLMLSKGTLTILFNDHPSLEFFI